VAHLRIFSYLPNPRVWKALIAAELCDVEVEVVGDKPGNLANWLWDYSARELTLADIAFVCDVGQFLRERLMVDRLQRL
jgi:hypothetical protein